MKIQILAPTCFLAILSPEETAALGLTFGDAPLNRWASLHCRLAAVRIFSQIIRQYSFPPVTGRVFLQASRLPSGEAVLLFRLSSQKQSRYRLPKQHIEVVFQFSQAEDLFRASHAMLHIFPDIPSCLYRWPSKRTSWRLILSVKLKQYPSICCIMGEYSNRCGSGRLSSAYTKEHGIFICKNAIQNLCGFHQKD